MAINPSSAHFLFSLNDRTFALPVDALREVLPIARLSRPPGMPTALEGFLALDGQQVPVLRLASLLGLPDTVVGLYTPLIVLRGADRDTAGVALLVDRVQAVVAQQSVAPLDGAQSFNGCVRSLLQVNGDQIPILAPGRLLLEEERRRIADFERLCHERLSAWGSQAEAAETPAGEVE